MSTIISTWDEVVQALHKIFDPLVAYHADRDRAEDLNDWIFNKLCSESGNSYIDTSNRRVASSIAFDSYSGNFEGEDFFKRILNRKDLSNTYYISSKQPEAAHIQFHRACNLNFNSRNPITLKDKEMFHEFYGCSFFSDDHPKSGYARCISLPVYFEYIGSMDENLKFIDMDLKEFVEDRIGWEEGVIDMPILFPSIPIENNVNMRGAKPLAWVAPSEKIRDSFGFPNPPVELAQRLGINIKEVDYPDPDYRDVLVVIYYTDDFLERVYHPATIHADWISGGFVPYKGPELCYGKTCNSCTPPGKELEERIHIAMPIVTLGPGAVKYKVCIAGRVNKSVMLNYEEVLSETLRRFGELLS